MRCSFCLLWDAAPVPCQGGGRGTPLDAASNCFVASDSVPRARLPLQGRVHILALKQMCPRKKGKQEVTKGQPTNRSNSTDAEVGVQPGSSDAKLTCLGSSPGSASSYSSFLQMHTLQAARFMSRMWESTAEFPASGWPRTGRYCHLGSEIADSTPVCLCLPLSFKQIHKIET